MSPQPAPRQWCAAKDSAKISYTARVYGSSTPDGKDGVIDATEGTTSYDALKPGLWAEGNSGAAFSFVAKAGAALRVHRAPSTPISGNLEYYRHVYATKTELVATIDNWVMFYNSVRRHSALGMSNPDDYEKSLRAAA